MEVDLQGGLLTTASFCYGSIGIKQDGGKIKNKKGELGSWTEVTA